MIQNPELKIDVVKGFNYTISTYVKPFPGSGFSFFSTPNLASLIFNSFGAISFADLRFTFNYVVVSNSFSADPNYLISDLFYQNLMPYCFSGVLCVVLYRTPLLRAANFVVRTETPFDTSFLLTSGFLFINYFFNFISQISEMMIFFKFDFFFLIFKLFAQINY